MKPIDITAFLRLKANGKGKSKRFVIKAYSGGLLPVDGFPHPVVVDLSGLEMPGSIPILIDHEKSVEATLGATDNIVNDGRQLMLEGVVTGVSAKSQQVLAQAAAGHTWQASIGAMVIESEDVPAGKTATANGQTFTGPVVIARRAVLRETSVLPMGADSTTSVNLAASARRFLKGSAAMSFEDYVKSLGMDVSTLTPEAVAVLQTSYSAMQSPASPAVAAAPAVPAPAPVAAPTAAAAVMLDLTASLEQGRKMIAAQFRKSAEIQAKASGHPEIIATAIDNDWSIEKVELEVMKKQNLQARSARPTSFRTAENKPENMPLVLEAALCVARKIKNVDKAYPDQILQAAHTQYRGAMSIKRLLIEAAVANGHYVSASEGVNRSNWQDIGRAAWGGQIQAGFSVVSLPGILSNVANKELLEGYMQEEQTWKEISRTASVADFKAVTSYRMLDDMEYEEVGPSGKIAGGSISEESYTRQARTYAKMFSLTRTQIINDDMSAFDDLRNRIGRGAAKKLNKVFWTKWLDNSAFFTSGRGNYITGATTTLLADNVGLELALDAFDNLRTPAKDGSKVPGGKFGGSPSILLTPGGGISRVAEQIYVNQNIGGGTTNANANIHAGKYKPVKSVFLNDSTVSGGSATAWYLLRNPSEAAGIVVSFLDGVETPTVEQQDAEFSTLGIVMRGYHDFGCDQAEYLCGVKSKGAA